ncbi:Chlorophyll(ide) b reductase NOL, chloroplastic, partial [Tetrabaena socialis]
MQRSVAQRGARSSSSLRVSFGSRGGPATCSGRRSSSGASSSAQRGCPAPEAQHTAPFRAGESSPGLARGQRVVARAVLGEAPATAKPTAVPQPPYNVVITGGTKGIGRALAEGFLRAGDKVIVCSRSGEFGRVGKVGPDERVLEAVAEMAALYGKDRVKGVAADVAKAGAARVLADYAAKEFGRIDIWINNAGTNAYRYGPISESSDEDLAQIVQTNVLGVMLCCKEAIRVMRAQPSHGHVFNMDGAGADGNATPRFAAYGATKRSLAQLGKSLGAELGIL